jgi:hypothetical protein
VLFEVLEDLLLGISRLRGVAGNDTDFEGGLVVGVNVHYGLPSNLAAKRMHDRGNQPGRRRKLERLKGRPGRVVNIEQLVEPGDLEDLVDLRGDVRQLKLAVQLTHLLVQCNQHS